MSARLHRSTLGLSLALSSCVYPDTAGLPCTHHDECAGKTQCVENVCGGPSEEPTSSGADTDTGGSEATGGETSGGETSGEEETAGDDTTDSSGTTGSGLCDGPGQGLCYETTVYLEEEFDCVWSPQFDCSAAVGDLDSDGLPDVIASMAKERWFLWGDGSGGLTPEGFSQPMSVYSHHHGIVDLNGDDINDWATTTHYYLGSGSSPPLTNAVEYGSGIFPLALDTADMDDDGRVEVVVIDGAGPAVVHWTDTGPTADDYDETAGFRAIRAIRAADLDGDGHPDVASTDNQPAAMRIFFNDGVGGLDAPIQVLEADSAAMEIGVGTFDDDGLTDVVGMFTDGEMTVRVYTHQTDRLFVESHVEGLSVSPWDMRVADFDGDGYDDVALLESAQIVILRGVGDGTLVDEGWSYPTSLLAYGMAVDDINEDTRPDIVLAGAGVEVFLSVTE